VRIKPRALDRVLTESYLKGAVLFFTAWVQISGEKQDFPSTGVKKGDVFSDLRQA